MQTKTKKSQPNIDKLAKASHQVGLMLMTAAVTIGMLELPDHPNNKVIVPNQPAFAYAGNNIEDTNLNNPVRREREEAGPHYISYSVNQRTPSRHGRV